MRINKLSAAVFAAIGPLATGIAWADCQADTASTPIDNGNDVIVCDNLPPDPDGVNAGSGDDAISIVPIPGGTHTVVGTINLGAGTDSLTNSGIISTSGNEAHVVYDPDGHATIVNHGGIRTTGSNSTGVFAAFGGHNTVTTTFASHISTWGENAEGINLGGGNNTVVNEGQIVTRGVDSIGIRVIAGTHDSVSNSGSIQTEGASADGIFSYSDDSTFTNSGSITTSGAEAHGIWVNATSGSSIASSGTITTSGERSDAIRLVGTGLGSATPSIDNSGTITTSGIDADAITVTGSDHLVVNSGTITTNGEFGTGDPVQGAQGIELVGNNSAIENHGSIRTHGRLANGVDAEGDGNSLTNTGTIGISGTMSSGMIADGDGNLVINETGGVIYGVYASTSSSAGSGLLVGGNGNTLTNRGDISEFGYGFRVFGDGNTLTNTASGVIGDVHVGMTASGTGNVLLNQGFIEAFGLGAGIRVYGDGSQVVNTAGATITTSGIADGIVMTGNGVGGASTNIGNYGTIDTIGDDADGIAVEGNNHWIQNSGSIRTAGNVDPGGDDGIFGRQAGASGIEVTGNDSIVYNEASGTIATTGADANAMLFAGNDNFAYNHGSLETSGANSAAMLARGNGNDLASQADGSIVTTGTNAAGIAAEGNESSLYNNGSLTTSGSGSHGLFTQGNDNSTYVWGSVATGGTDADGIRVEGDRTDAFGTTPDIRIDNSPTGTSIVTNGNDADAVSVVGNGHWLQVAGSLTTTGTTGGIDGLAGRPSGSQGIEVLGEGNTVEVLADGTVTANGDDAHGIAMFGSGNIANAGALTTTGLRSEGIMLNRGGGNIVNTGTISTAGLYSDGIEANGVYFSTTVDNAGGTITTTGERSYGIRLVFGDKTAVNSGLIDTSGNAAHGIIAGNIPDGGTNYITNANGGRIQTSGQDARGIDTEANSRVENHGEIETAGVNAHGIGAGGGDNHIVNDATGSIVTSGATASGISVGNSFYRADGDSIVNAGTIATSGLNAEGIAMQGDATDPAITSIDSSGDIATTGNDADGISVLGDAHVIRNSGTIVTQGNVDGADAADGRVDGAQGIELVGDDNRLEHGGSITTSGGGAAGIVLIGDDNQAMGSDASSIATTGTRAYGMLALGDGNALDNSGSISTQGAIASGLRASGDGNTLSNAGNIETAGTSAHVVAAAGDGNVLVNLAGGSIATTGDFGNGLHAFGSDNQLGNAGEVLLSGDGGDGLYASGGSNQVVNEAGGLVHTSGERSNAMLVWDHDNIVVNAGSLDTAGLASDGMRVNGNVVTALAAGAASVDNSGDITTGGDDADGISVVGNGHVIRSSGTIATAGRTAVGMRAALGSNTLSNTGSISTQGDYAHGMEAAGDGNTLSNDTGGNISTAGNTAHGIYALGSDNTVINAGSIATVNAAGVLLQGANNALDNSGSITMVGNDAGVRLDSGTTATIVNSGTIDSAAQCVSGAGAGATSLSSSGSLDCGVVAVQLGAADDSVSLLDGSTTIGNIDLGDGSDSIVLDVDAGLAGRLSGDLLAAESLTKSGAGLFTLSGDAEVGFSSAHIDAGVLALQDGVLTGHTFIGSGGALLTRQYAFRGNIDNAGTLDSRSGILAIDGNYRQRADGTLRLRSNVSGSASSRIEASGSASLDGHVDVTITDPANLVLGYNEILLVDADGGRSGEFASHSDNLADGVDTELVYTTGQALLRIALEPDADSLRGFGEASALATAQLGRLVDQRLRVLQRSRHAVAAGSATGGATPVHEGAWGEVYASQSERDGSDGFEADLAGALVGVDFSPAAGTLWGVFAGANDTATASGRANGNVQSLDLGGYASQSFGRGYLEAIAHYGVQDYRIRRRTLGGSVATSTHDGEAFGVRIAGGFAITDGFSVFDQLGYDHVDQDGYVESGAAGLDQAIAAESFESLRNRLGLRLAGVFATDADGVVAPWLELAWVHDFGLDQAQVLARPAAGAAPVVLSVAEGGDDNGTSLRVGLAWLHDNLTLSVQAHGERRGEVDVFGAGVQFGWVFE